MTRRPRSGRQLGSSPNAGEPELTHDFLPLLLLSALLLLLLLPLLLLLLLPPTRPPVHPSVSLLQSRAPSRCPPAAEPSSADPCPPTAPLLPAARKQPQRRRSGRAHVVLSLAAGPLASPQATLAPKPEPDAAAEPAAASPSDPPPPPLSTDGPPAPADEPAEAPPPPPADDAPPPPGTPSGYGAMVDGKWKTNKPPVPARVE